MIELKQKISENELIKKEAALLLQSPEDAEAFRAMNIMSPHNKKSELLAKAAEIATKENFSKELFEKYNGTKAKLFTEEEIVKECIKFNMYFGPTKDFKGEFSLGLIKKVNSFLTENKLLLTEDQYRTNVFILAHMEFHSKKSGRAKFKTNQKDPLVFFKIQERGEFFYILIDGNKQYKSLLNRAKGYIFYHENNSRLVFAFAVLLVFTLCMYFLRVHSWEFSIWKWLMVIPCYGIASLLNMSLYNYYDNSNERAAEWDKANDRFFREKYNYVESKIGQNKESSFVLAFCILVVFMANAFVLNMKLRKEGSLTVLDSTESVMTEKQIHKAGLVFDPLKEYFENTSYVTTYTPGAFFHTKETKTTGQNYTTKPKE